MSYNGWSNRETWLINVWFNPETKADLEMIKERLEEDLEAIPDYLKDFIDDGIIDWNELEEALDPEEEETEE